jgi:5-methylcytosine-specific restriction endonuclease McrA
MEKPAGPRPIIVEIAQPFGLEIKSQHWSKGSTVTKDYFLDLFEIVVGRPYDGKLDKRSIAEALLIYAGGKRPEEAVITDDMFSNGGTITNIYFIALKEALELCRDAERNGYVPSDESASVSEVEEAADELPEGGNEGRLRLVSHYRRERKKSVSITAKRIARRLHPERFLVCEICALVPERIYGEDTIEAHHRIPLNQVVGSRKVMPSDLAMLCPNCHRAVHKMEGCNMAEVTERLRISGVIR